MLRLLGILLKLACYAILVIAEYCLMLVLDIVKYIKNWFQ